MSVCNIKKLNVYFKGKDNTANKVIVNIVLTNWNNASNIHASKINTIGKVIVFNVRIIAAYAVLMGAKNAKKVMQLLINSVLNASNYAKVLKVVRALIFKIVAYNILAKKTSFILMVYVKTVLTSIALNVIVKSVNNVYKMHN